LQDFHIIALLPITSSHNAPERNFLRGILFLLYDIITTGGHIMVTQNIEDNIMTVRFGNPPTYAMTFKTMTGILDAVKKVKNDDSLKGLIFTGEGKFFCSGFDLPTFLAFKTRDDIADFFTVEEEMLYELFTLKKPAIAAINGHCTAGGFIVAMGCDYRIATDNPKAKMGMTEIKIGFGLTIAEMEMVRFGLNSNRDLCDVMFEGEKFTFHQAYDLGYVNELVDEERLIARCKEKICGWMDLPGRAFMSLKEGIRDPVAQEIRRRLDSEDWITPLHESINKPEVRSILEIMVNSKG